MSGNPFRASLVPQYPAAPPTSSYDTDIKTQDARYERGDDAVLDASSAPSTKTKKSVRIESPTETIPPHPDFDYGDSPPISPPSSQHMNHGYRSSPPSFGTHAAFSNSSQYNDVDGASIPGSSDDRAMRAVPAKYVDSLEAMRISSGAPANPFAKTLANLEPQRTTGGEREEPNKDRIPGGEALPGATKSALDVESFKNMLMSGISSPRGSGPPPPQNAPTLSAVNPPVLESSSTDTSSISRQSIFETVQEPHPESPHTLYDMAASDDEKVGLNAEVRSKKEKRKSLPPPAPKRRHGKPVGSRTPQTVSFEGFQPTTDPPPTVKKHDSETNKPLPPTPPTASSSPRIISPNSTYDIPESRKADVSTHFDTAPAAQKKVPPPVPLARRHSQLRNTTIGTRSRSNSSLTMSSQHSIEIPTPSPGLKEEPTSSSSSFKAPPPPPPSRHRGSVLPTIGTSSANSSTTDISSSGTVRNSTVISPNPPASRRTTLTSEPPSPQIGLGRASSVHSTRSSHRIVSNESTGSMPPPPPPPRRRQSGRSAGDKDQAGSTPSSPVLDHRRTSVEYKRSSPDSKRRASAASESSLKYEYAPASASTDNEHPLYSPREDESEDKMDSSVTADRPANRMSILDDMDRFQKEIEELRERYRHAA